MEEPSLDEKATESAPTINVRDLTAKALDFLSTASSETIGACVVGLGAATYLILGRLGLVLIGVVVGVFLHASWEGTHNGQTRDPDKTRRKEIGLEILHRLLDQRHGDPQSGHPDPSKNDDFDIELLARQELTFERFEPETADALTSIVDAVIKDYVK